MTGALSDGSHHLFATATDAAGNVSALSQDLDPVIGTGPAAPSITSFSTDSGVVGDHITAVKTTMIDSEKDLVRALAKAGVGTKWRFYIMRGDKEIELDIELGKGL